MKRIEVKKGQILQEKGDLNTKVYHVESGLLRSFSIDDKGKEHIYMFAPKNWIITDSCGPEMPCELFIDVLEDGVLIEREKDMAIQNVDFKVIAKRLNALQNRVIMLMSASAADRYEHFVKTYPDIIQRVTQRMVASYLGITPEALSRVRKGLSHRK